MLKYVLMEETCMSYQDPKFCKLDDKINSGSFFPIPYAMFLGTENGLAERHY